MQPIFDHEGYTKKPPTPIHDGYQNRINNLSNILIYAKKELKVNDFAGFSREGGNPGKVYTTGFVKKINQKNIIVESFYQFGAAGYNDGQIMELKTPKR